MTVIYIIWITIGTAYYAAGSMDLGFCKGYYMCVNVGYSIGWGYPTETEDSQYFFGTYHGNDLISLPHNVLKIYFLCTHFLMYFGKNSLI